MRNRLFWIFLVLILPFLIESASKEIFKIVRPLHLHWDKHLIRAADPELEYRIRKDPFRSDLKFLEIGDLKENDQSYPVLGKLSFDSKEGNLRSAEGDFFLNERGFRGPYFEKNKHPKQFRVIALGDSTTAGTHENELTYPRILERMLTNQFEDLHFQVINAGVWGYTSCQINKIYKNEVSKFQPDMIILSLGWNDFQHGLFTETEAQNKSHYCKEPTAFEKTYTFMLLHYYFKKYRKYFLPQKPFYEHSFKTKNLKFFTKNIVEIIEDAKRKGISLGLFELPAMIETSEPVTKQMRYPQLSKWNPRQLEFQKRSIPLINTALKSIAAAYPHVFFC